MGTNFYIKVNRCKYCGRCEKEIHLGKSSAGWQFSFQYNGGEYYKNIQEMKDWLKDKQIWNEYDEKITYKDFWKMVKDKQNYDNKHFIEFLDKDNFIINGYFFSDCEFS